MDLPTQIEARLNALGVKPGEVEEKFVRGTGPGGQKINKVSSTVTLHHRASGVEIRRQQERSQLANRRLARLGLCEKLERRRKEARAMALAAREKERRRKRTRSAAQKRRMVADKRKRSLVKRKRGRVRDD